MAPYRVVPIFDPRARPPSWSERMRPGEYAVLLTNAVTGSVCGPAGEPVLDVNSAPCLIFPSLEAAVTWSEEELRAVPELRCRVYDHHGMGGSPPRVIVDPKYVKHEGFSRKASLRIGLFLVATGGALVVAEVLSDWRLLWASTIGTRLLPAGLLLIVTEGALRLNDWDRRRRGERNEAKT